MPNKNLVFTDKREKMSVIAYCMGVAESFDQNNHKYIKAKLRDLNGEVRTVQGFDSYYDGYINLLEQGKVYNIDVFYDGRYYNFVNAVGTENKEIECCEFLGDFCYDEAYKKRFIALYKELRTPLHELLQKVFHCNKQDFITFGNIPYSEKGAYNKRGGVFKLTVDLAEFVKRNAEKDGLDVDLCVASAMLYNIGEIDTKTIMGDDVEDIALQDTKVNIANRLTRAITLMEKEGFEFDYEEFQMIYHIIGVRDFHDIPAIPEAILIRMGNEYLKMMDMCYNGLENLKPGQSQIDWSKKTAAYKPLRTAQTTE